MRNLVLLKPKLCPRPSCWEILKTNGKLPAVTRTVACHWTKINNCLLSYLLQQEEIFVILLRAYLVLFYVSCGNLNREIWKLVIQVSQKLKYVFGRLKVEFVLNIYRIVCKLPPILALGVAESSASRSVRTMPENLCLQQTKGDVCKVDKNMSETTLHYRLQYSCWSIICRWIIRVYKERCLKCTNWTSQDSSNLHIWQPNCGFKFCSSLLYSGGNTERCLKEIDRTVSICGIWNVKLLWNTIERSPSQSLIRRASNLLRFRSVLNYFWASQCFISEGAEVVCDFCQSLHLQATDWVKK
jgi:hypothetical protein